MVKHIKSAHSHKKSALDSMMEIADELTSNLEHKLHRQKRETKKNKKLLRQCIDQNIPTSITGCEYSFDQYESCARTIQVTVVSVKLHSFTPSVNATRHHISVYEWLDDNLNRLANRFHAFRREIGDMNLLICGLDTRELTMSELSMDVMNMASILINDVDNIATASNNNNEHLHNDDVRLKVILHTGDLHLYLLTPKVPRCQFTGPVLDDLLDLDRAAVADKVLMSYMMNECAKSVQSLNYQCHENKETAHLLKVCMTVCGVQATILIRKNFKCLFCMFHILPSISAKPSMLHLCQKKLSRKLLRSTFCNQILYITIVCKVVSRITKVALQNNF